MQLCFDATRFGTGLDGAIRLAAERGLPAVEYSFAPFPISAKSDRHLDAGEQNFLQQVGALSKELDVSITCLNLDFCLDPTDKKASKHFALMLAKLAHLAKAVNCSKISILLAASPGNDQNWIELAGQQLQTVSNELKSDGVNLLLRLATPPQFRNQSLKAWQAMEPQDWRDLLSVSPGIGLSFSPADCLWLGVDYLKILSGFASAIEHIEAHDVEVIHELLKDSGIYGPLWWRYRRPGKGQVDWTQLIEALKLYDFKGTFSIHLDDEFVSNDPESLGAALSESIKLLAPLVKD